MTLIKKNENLQDLKISADSLCDKNPQNWWKVAFLIYIKKKKKLNKG